MVHQIFIKKSDKDMLGVENRSYILRISYGFFTMALAISFVGAVIIFYLSSLAGQW
jgi:hypothetical protein